jgi:hypothetical protein
VISEAHITRTVAELHAELAEAYAAAIEAEGDPITASRALRAYAQMIRETIAKTLPRRTLQ